MHLKCRLQKRSGHFVPTWLFKHIDTGTNWPPFYIHHFQIYFLRCKFLYFIHISLDLLSRAPRGPTKNRPSVIHVMLWCAQRAIPIILANDVLLHCYNYATLGLNELIRNTVYYIYMYIYVYIWLRLRLIHICMYIYIYIYIYTLRFRYLSLQVIDHKHCHKAGNLHIGCKFWNRIWVQI